MDVPGWTRSQFFPHSSGGALDPCRHLDRRVRASELGEFCTHQAVLLYLFTMQVSSTVGVSAPVEGRHGGSTMPVGRGQKPGTENAGQYVYPQFPITADPEDETAPGLGFWWSDRARTRGVNCPLRRVAAHSPRIRDFTAISPRGVPGFGVITRG
jgi:hypothetical protein